MEIELVDIQHSSVESQLPGETDNISQLSDPRNTSYNMDIEEEFAIPPNIPKSRKMNAIGVVLFISLSITAGVLTVCLTSPNLSKTCERVFQRKMESSIVLSSQPRSVALGYLNNDQHVDIVVANSGTDSIGILLDNGNETFADQKTYSTGLGSLPYSVIVNSFNNDNYSDVVVANYGTNNIGIFLGKGNGTFNDQKTFTLGSSRPLFIASGDFNKDNRMDIAVINYGTNNIGILLGDGNGLFQAQITYSTGYDSFPSSLVVADFNNDGSLDIAAANYGTDNIGIFLGFGNGTFASQQTYATLLKSNPVSIAVGDFNNDNKLDIAVANNGTGAIGIFVGYGNGSFQEQITYSIGPKSCPQYIAVGNLNTDNELDIVVVDSQHNQVHVLPSSGNGSFTTITTYDGISGSHPLCVAVTDLNSDNRSDIVVVNYGTSNVLILIDYSSKPSLRQTNYGVRASASIVSVAASDVNNDETIDVIYLRSGYMRLRIGLGDGTFGSEIKYPISTKVNPQYMCAGDLNNDTRTDIVVASITFDEVTVFLEDDDGSFGPSTPYTISGSSPYWVALGDVNNDGQLDIIAANAGSNTICIRLGNGDGTFRTVASYSTDKGIKPYSVALGDLNHDNYLDFVVSNVNSYILVFLGYGNGSFIIWTGLETLQNSFSFSIALGDFNNDTHLDIVVANTNANNIGIFLGYGNATFGSQTLYSTGSTSQPYYVIVADFNNDNIFDIAATNVGSDQVIIFHGLGNGSFQLHIIHSTGVGSKPYGVAAADFDNNKQMDMVVALSGNKQIAILTEYTAALFVNQTKYSTGSAPRSYSVVIGDFNKDNRSDIVVANSGTDNLSILFALDNGTFDMTMKYQIGTDFSPQYVITCDVNNDDQLDIVSVNSKADSISVIMGYGNGSFAEQLIYSTRNNSYSVAIASGDFNNDARLDLVIANEGTDDIGIYFGFNYTVFQNQKKYSRDDSLATRSVTVADFNNDSYLDIAVTFELSNEIGILLGNGNGNFTSIMAYSTGNGSKPSGIAVFDFNNDGRLDIVVANYGNNCIGVFLGYGNGSFTTITTYSTGESSGPCAVTVGDVNNDNELDIIVANYGSSSVGVLLGSGTGSFSNVMIFPTGTGSNCWSVAVGDFNSDDNLDIAVANYGTHNVGILLGRGDGTFEDQMILSMTGSSRPMRLAIGDFNRDNRLDIAVADWNNHYIGIFIGYEDGIFDTMITYSSGDGSLPRHVSLGDFNNDNISDIAVVNQGTTAIVVLFGLGDGTFLLGTPHSIGIGSQPYALAIGDFNNDSQLDIVVANYAANNIGVFLAYDNQPFASMKLYPIEEGSEPHSVAVSDLNKDGFLDILIVNYGTDNLGILLGYGNGNFETIVKYSTGTGSAPSSVSIADFNNDTYPDIVVTNSQIDTITIFLGVGYGEFVTGMDYSTGVGSYPYTVNTGDFNNDNITDIAVANYGTSNILLLYGHGNGTFGNQTSYRLGYNYHPYSIAVTDFNQDNWLDIVVACYGTDHVETLINICL